MGYMAINCLNYLSYYLFRKIVQRSPGWVQARDSVEGSENLVGEQWEDKWSEARFWNEDVAIKWIEWDSKAGNKEYLATEEGPTASWLWQSEEWAGNQKDWEGVEVSDWEDEERFQPRKGADSERSEFFKIEAGLWVRICQEETGSWQGTHSAYTPEISDWFYWENLWQDWGKGDQD